MELTIDADPDAIYDEKGGVMKLFKVTSTIVQPVTTETFVLASTPADAIDQARCKTGTPTESPTVEQIPMMIRGWSQRTF